MKNYGNDIMSENLHLYTAKVLENCWYFISTEPNCEEAKKQFVSRFNNSFAEDFFFIEADEVEMQFFFYNSNYNTLGEAYEVNSEQPFRI